MQHQPRYEDRAGTPEAKAADQRRATCLVTIADGEAGPAGCGSVAGVLRTPRAGARRGAERSTKCASDAIQMVESRV